MWLKWALLQGSYDTESAFIYCSQNIHFFVNLLSPTYFLKKRSYYYNVMITHFFKIEKNGSLYLPEYDQF